MIHSNTMRRQFGKHHRYRNIEEDDDEFTRL